MSTTAIFVELLVGGIQASIWIALLVLSFTGVHWITTGLQQLEKWQVIITALVFAGWYSLGIIIDRFSRVVYMVYDPSKLMKKMGIVKRQIAKTSADISRAEIVAKAGDAYEYLEYFRSRARIVRATVFNTIFTTIAAVIFIYSQCGSLGCVANQNNMAWVAIIIGAVVFLFASITSGMLELAYDERVTQIQDTLRKSSIKK